MTIMGNSERQKILESIKLHTASYANDPAFKHRWSGLTDISRNYRAQQIRAFGELIGAVTATLSDWRVLDIGCGDGHWLRTLVEYDAQPRNLIGVDVSNARFAEARARNSLINLLQIDGPRLPFKDNEFDLVMQWVCFSNIPTISWRLELAAEMQRVVKRGGFIFWWDLPHMTTPTEVGKPLQLTDYFNWPMRILKVGQQPVISEILRPDLQYLKPVGAFFNFIAYPPTHIAALIGPEPF